MARARRLAASASLLTSAGGVAWIALRDAFGTYGWINWHALAFAGVLGAAAVGITRRSVVAQVLSRAMAWIVFAPTAIGIVAELMLRGPIHVDGALAAFAITSGASLLLASPMLHTDEARRAFAPSKLRRSFLAASTLAAAVGIVTGVFAYDGLHSGHVAAGLAVGALGTSLLGAAIGVLRMRAWGILLAMASAVASLAAGVIVGGGGGFALAWTALPGAVFALLVALAKLGVADAKHDALVMPTRVATGADSDELPSRVRVALDEPDAALADETTLAAPPQRAVASP